METTPCWITPVRIIWIALRLLLLVAVVAPLAYMAANSRLNVHPDESVHVDAFHWYAHHWLRPEPGDRRLEYSEYGWSRVFTGESAYFLYGRIGAIVNYFHPAAEANAVAICREYRFINLAMLALTLGILLFARGGPWFSPLLLALVVISVPQASYVYGYANSDGFGLSSDLWLLAYAAVLVGRGVKRWGIRQAVQWWLLCLLVLLSKAPCRLGIIIPVGLMIQAMIVGRREIARPSVQCVTWWATRLIVPMIAVYCLAAWWDPSYGPHHAQWEARLWEARQETAEPSYRGEIPKHWGRNRAGKGNDYEWLFQQKTWLKDTGESFYSRFGGWKTHPPEWLFLVAGSLLLLGVELNLIGLTSTRIPAPLIVALALAGPVILLNFAGDAWVSLHIDYQPQGRYLFASIAPLYFLWAGAIPVARRWIRWPHVALVLVPAIVFALYHLWQFGLFNPRLYPR